jgi:hypothetical protein
MQDKRTEVRMLCADMLEISWRDERGKLQKLMGLLEDISPRGACLQLDCSLPVGTEVSFETPEQRYTGCVRYCIYREVGFFAGVEFEGATWSKNAFEPQHFLDPQKLAEHKERPGGR